MGRGREQAFQQVCNIRSVVLAKKTPISDPAPLAHYCLTPLPLCVHQIKWYGHHWSRGGLAGGRGVEWNEKGVVAMTLLGNPPDDPITSLPIPGPMPSSCESCPSRNPAIDFFFSFKG